MYQYLFFCCYVLLILLGTSKISFCFLKKLNVETIISMILYFKFFVPWFQSHNYREQQTIITTHRHSLSSIILTINRSTSKKNPFIEYLKLLHFRNTFWWICINVHSSWCSIDASNTISKQKWNYLLW